MRHEITVASASPGATLHIFLAGRQGFFSLMHRGVQLALVAFPTSTPPIAIVSMGTASASVATSSSRFEIAPGDAPRLQAWLAEAVPG